MSVNKVFILGFCAKDPEVKEVGGVKCATFSLPTTKKFKGKDGNIQEKTAWHNIVCWRNTAEIVEKYVKKGTQLYVEGEIDYRSWEKDGEKRFATDIVVSNIQLLGSKNPQDAQEGQPKKFDPHAAKTTPIVDDLPPDDDQLPF